MKSAFYKKMFSIIFYILLASMLLQFKMSILLQPVPFISVIIGIIILTLSQFEKGHKLEDFLANAGWNAILSGILTSILSILSLLSSEAQNELTIRFLAEHMVPLLYGGLLYIVLELLGIESKIRRPEAMEENETVNPSIVEIQLFNQIQQTKVHSILIAHGFTLRECHVATKILSNRPNKEIAEELYISEATVKKHIQNMFKKCGASNRQEFQQIFIGWYKENT